MNKQNDQEQYLNFMNAAEIKAPEYLRQVVENNIVAKMQINPQLIWGKIIAVHAALATLALATCPQFKIELTSFHSPLLHFFHQFEPWWCSLLCGAYFFLLGSLFSHFLLNKKELNFVANYQHIFHLLMLGLSLSFFALFGSGVFELMTIFWAIGAMTSLWGFFNLGLLIRQRI